MKIRERFLLGLLLILPTGCAHFAPPPASSAQSARDFNARSLEDAGLKQFLEHNLGQPLEPWPLEAWDLPKLTLAAWYFHPRLDAARMQWRRAEAELLAARGGPKSAPARGRPPPTGFQSGPRLAVNRLSSEGAAERASRPAPASGAEAPRDTPGKKARRIAVAERLSDSARLRMVAVAWQVRAGLRSNLLAYAAAERRQDLLHEVEAIQIELEQSAKRRLEPGALPYVELSLLQLELARTRLAFILALEDKINSRQRVAESLALPVRALFHVEIACDFSRAAGVGVDAPTLRRLALQSRPDVRIALADYAAAEDALRSTVSDRPPGSKLDPGWRWDLEKNRWAVNLELPLLASAAHNSAAKKAEACRVKAAARLLSLQADVLDELDRGAALYRMRLQDAAEIDREAAAIQQQRDAVEARFKANAAIRPELLLVRLQSALAELAQLDAQEKLQQALGSLEDAVQQPAEQWGWGQLQSGPQF